MAEPLLVIKGIPKDLHVPDLRVFFEPAVEQGLFSCFHFRRTKTGAPKPGELTCRVRAASKEAAEEIARCFHNVPWKEVLIDAPVSIKARCVVEAARAGTQTADAWELHPPPALPEGNVGTCRAAVLSAIRSCRLPASVIKRLGIVPGKLRSTRSCASIPPPLCWRDPEPESAEHENELDSKRNSKAQSSTAGASPLSEAKIKAEERPSPLASAIFASLKKRSRPKKAEMKEEKAKARKLQVAKPASALKSRKMCAAISEGEGSEPEIEGRHLSRPLDEDPDDFDEPLEKAPHYERSDRLDSAAGYLYEDTVEHIWDKQDASGLVWYTDAAFWDRMAGGLDERCADGWDVEPSDEGSDDAATPSREPRVHLQPKAMEQGTGLAAVRQGVAGRIMRSWGGCPSSAPSSTLLAVVEGMQPNLSRTGLGWAGEHQRSRPRLSRPEADGDWNRIGSIYDPPQEEIKQRSFSVRPSLPASFSAASLYFAEDRRRHIAFVPASGNP